MDPNKEILTQTFIVACQFVLRLPCTAGYLPAQIAAMIRPDDSWSFKTVFTLSDCNK